MHHRKQFWEYFSFLQGRDAKLCKMKECVFFAKYDEMIEFLLKQLATVQHYFSLFHYLCAKI